MGYLVTCLGILLLIDLYSQVNRDIILSALVYIFRLMVYINFLLMIVYPDGVYTVNDIYSSAVTRYNFLGLDNQTGPYFILLMTLSLCRQYTRGSRINVLCKTDIVICIISILFLWSATAVVGLIIFLAFILLISKNKHLANLRTSYLIIGLLFVIVVIFQATTMLKPIFEGLLNKDVTLTGRTFIWKEAISMIILKPILGYGIQDSPNLVYFFIYQDFRTAHNEYLQVWLQGGIGCVLILIAQLSRVRRVISQSGYQDKSSLILRGGIVTILVMMLTESYGQMLVFYVLIFYTYFHHRHYLIRT
ncbi:O-antigen ligase family protein [Aquibacillus kalidii]|uniref:O-antigen ligase family protein n=1 Tax=Aquibacillus kalidii TaxID=2762597 RepID=UPI0016444484|nr:O-antigen ligase family protein [Aquibacillus kalidii]